ncbi:efflux RND transporter periplasmic adaptor subunit [Bacteroidota bacterium]
MNKLLIAAIIIAFTACKAKVSEDEGREDMAVVADEIVLSDEQVSMAGIVSGKLEQMTLSETLSCNGSVEIPPQSLVYVTLPQEGYVKSIHSYTGSSVKKGDLLAVMEHPGFLDLQQEYLVSGNNLALLKKDLDRQETLAREDAASDKILMAARTEYENTLVRHTALGEQLKMLGIDPAGIIASSLSSEVKVYSSINGHVRMNHANMGELMSAGSPIMELEDVSHLHVHLIIYEKDVNRVREGQEVEFTTGVKDRKYRGKIITAGKSIDEETRSVMVHVHISDPDAALLSGMYIKARIMLDQSTVYALPEEGIAESGGQNFVFIRSGNSFLRIPVNTGIIQDGFVEIISPGNLLEKELVLAGAYYLNSALSAEE